MFDFWEHGLKEISSDNKIDDNYVCIVGWSRYGQWTIYLKAIFNNIVLCTNVEHLKVTLSTGLLDNNHHTKICVTLTATNSSLIFIASDIQRSISITAKYREG